jgi:hypothetical protein
LKTCQASRRKLRWEFKLPAAVPFDFDWETYIENYPDLQQADWVNSERGAKQHWVEFGRNEGRTYKKLKQSDKPHYSENEIPPDFDWQTYVNNYGDLMRSNINTQEQAVDHWLKIGRKEGRTYKPIIYQPLTVRPDFDWKTYVNNYSDLRSMGINTKAKAIEHWLKHGKREGRTYRPLNAPMNSLLFSQNKSPKTSAQSLKTITQKQRAESMDQWLQYWSEMAATTPGSFVRAQEPVTKRAEENQAMDFWLNYWSTRTSPPNNDFMTAKNAEEDNAMEYWLKYWSLKAS